MSKPFPNVIPDLTSGLLRSLKTIVRKRQRDSPPAQGEFEIRLQNIPHMENSDAATD